MTTITKLSDRRKIEQMDCSVGECAQFRMRLPVEVLEIGMHVDELDKPWLESRFLFQGFLIKSEVELQALREECEHVLVTVTRRVSRSPQKAGLVSTEGAKIYPWPAERQD